VTGIESILWDVLRDFLHRNKSETWPLKRFNMLRAGSSGGTRRTKPLESLDKEKFRVALAQQFIPADTGNNRLDRSFKSRR
jgi:hypothetical protein